MTSLGLLQILGNLTVGLAGLLYAIPLQLLVRDISRKRDDGGGAFAVLLVLVPMWLLLSVAVLCVAALGSLDWVRLDRLWLYAIVPPATISLGIVSSFAIERVPHASRASRLVVGSLIHLLPLLTIALAVGSLNPDLAPEVLSHLLEVAWVATAALCLALCGGYALYRLAAAGVNRIRAVTHRFRLDLDLSMHALAEIATLDPERDFNELARRTAFYARHAVRAAALERLRRHPDFIGRLQTELTQATASSGALEHVLAVTEFADFTAEERARLALPARGAMGRITRFVRSEVRHFTMDRRRQTQRWGRELFQSLARKFADTGINFQPALDGFAQAFRSHDEPAP
jgi:hypothetical protein